VALGAFLSHGGSTTPLAVFLIAWIFNTASAMLVYALVRRSGRRFLALPGVRQLMAPEAIAVIERDYLRLGALGLLVARFLPGIRAVVPPFAGLFRIPAGRVLLCIAVASGIWYGAITWVGATVGSEFSHVKALVSAMGRTAAIVALGLGVLLFLFILARRRRREEPVITAVRAALGQDADPHAPIDLRHAARLVIEIAYADHGLAATDRVRIEDDLRARWELGPKDASRAPAGQLEDDRLTKLGLRLGGEVGRERRLALIEQMWQSAFAEGDVDVAQEEWLLRRAGELLGLGSSDVARVRARAGARVAPPE
jgi:membrane protein DedA with SNARE-associated domain/uncharacterized tellurite resistance protein B-like protein